MLAVTKKAGSCPREAMTYVKELPATGSSVDHCMPRTRDQLAGQRRPQCMLFACALGIHPDKMCTDGKGWLYGLLSCLA